MKLKGFTLVTMATGSKLSCVIIHWVTPHLCTYDAFLKLCTIHAQLWVPVYISISTHEQLRGIQSHDSYCVGSSTVTKQVEEQWIVTAALKVLEIIIRGLQVESIM